MKYFIFIASLLLLSSASYPPQAQRITTHKGESKIHPPYLSVDSYQDDYTELQEKSLNIDTKVKNILETIKPR